MQTYRKTCLDFDCASELIECLALVVFLLHFIVVVVRFLVFKFGLDGGAHGVCATWQCCAVVAN